MGIYKKYFNKYKMPFLIAVLCVSLEAFCDLLAPTFMAKIINLGIEKNELNPVLTYGAYMLLVTALGAVFAVIRNILASKVSQRVGADLRKDLFSKIVNFSEESVDKIESGSLITRMTNDTSQIVQFVNGIMRIFLKAPITCIGSIVLATLLNFRLSIIIYSVVAVVGCLIYISMKMSYPRFSKLQLAMDKVNSVVQEYLIGVRLVKAFGTYDEESERFRKSNNELMNKGISSQIIITFISPLLNLTLGIGTVIVILIGSFLFRMNMVGVGDISAFTIYMSQILSSLLMITNVFNTFVRTKASTARIKEVLDCEADFAETGEEKHLKGNIKFEDVTFAYPNGSGLPVLNHISFSVSSGETLAIIGPTGSGKSTIAWLLLRFYDVDTGSILIDNNNIKNLGADMIRKNISIVPQKAMLFSGTVESNIKWGNMNANEKMIQKALLEAQADFVFNMEHGVKSELGSGGVNLSGGQKQRISIARSLLKNAAILILDDATSALDAITEAKVRNNLIKEELEKTIILITQRCTTAMTADKILVLENGLNVGFGTHSELMQTCSVYKDIYKSQIESSRRD